MLTDEPPRDLPGRNEIIDVSERGLTLHIDGHEKPAPWSAITGVSAGRAKVNHNSDRWIFVLAIEIELRGEERLFIVGEIEPMWLSLTGILPSVLPRMESYDVWGVTLAGASSPLELYTRARDVR